MKDLAAIKRPISSRIPEVQTGLALLDATVAGTKAKDLETKLHRLIIGQEEAIDEIEKASDALWNLLLGILGKGTLTLGNKPQVDFSFRETDAWETLKTNRVAGA